MRSELVTNRVGGCRRRRVLELKLSFNSHTKQVGKLFRRIEA